MGGTTNKKALRYPTGNDTADVAQHMKNLAEDVDAKTASQDQADRPFFLKSAVYDVNHIDLTLGPGKAIFNGGTIVDKSVDTVYTINAPVINTAYYLYLKSDGTFTHNTTGLIIPGQVLIWQVATGNPVSVITTTDKRFEMVEALGYTPANKAGETFTGGVVVATGAATPIKSEKLTSYTNAVSAVMTALHTTDQNMADGFGSKLQFSIKDNAGIDNVIAAIVASRNTADNSGDLSFRTYLAGVEKNVLSADKDGNVFIPLGALSIEGGGGTLRLKSGTQDHVYISFYPDTDNPNTRSGYMGFPTPGGSMLVICNEINNADIMLDTQGTGKATVNGYEIRHTGNSGVATGSYTGDGTANRQINVGLNTQPKRIRVYKGDYTGTNIYRITPSTVHVEVPSSTAFGLSSTSGGAAAQISAGVVANATGFVTGNTATDQNSLNKSGVVYYWDAEA